MTGRPWQHIIKTYIQVVYLIDASAVKISRFLCALRKGEAEASGHLLD